MIRKILVYPNPILRKKSQDDLKTMYGFINNGHTTMLSLNDNQKLIYNLFF
jgi:hypothetical protein